MRINPAKTGSPEVQVAILTERINNLTEHFRATRRTTIPVASPEDGLPAPLPSRLRQEEGRGPLPHPIEKLGIRR
jgi:hypothetical protein